MKPPKLPPTRSRAAQRRQICGGSLAALGLLLAGRRAGGADAPFHPQLVAATHALLVSLPDAPLARFLRDWPARDRGERPVSPAALPVLRWLGPLVAAAPPAAAAVVRELGACAGSLRWRQTYPAQRVGRAFLDNYGWAELLGSTGEVPSTELVVGFLMLGPHTRYPRHAHAAEELYVPLSGRARWFKASAGWRSVEPLHVVQHAANEVHAMRTAAEPLLALYLWHGPGLTGKAHLVGGDEGDEEPAPGAP